MSETEYTPVFNSSNETSYNAIFEAGEYTFTADFTEFAVMYSGLTNVWIGDGTELDEIQCKGGTAGYLYGKYSNGTVLSIGFVSDYEAARRYYAEHGLDLNLTYDEWIELIKSTPANVSNSLEYRLQSESWAVGTRNGSSDTIRINAATDNSKYYSEQSASSANTSTAQASAASASAANALTSETNAAVSEANAAASASAASTSEDNAELYMDTAAEWATGDSIGTPSATNNALYYSQQASSSATAAATSEYNASVSETNASTSETNAATSESHAATSETNAHSSEVNAEQWATGGSGAIYVSGNSAKEQADRAAVWATGSSTGDGGATNNSKYYSEQSNEYELQSESWAVGTRNGIVDAVRTNAAQDNSKYYSEVSASEAIASQAWAETGTNLPSGSKSAKNWAQDAHNSANDSASSANTAGAHETNASTYATNAANSATASANSATASAASASAAATSETNASTSASIAANWAAGSEHGTPSDTNNAKYYANYTDQRISALGNFLASSTTVYQNSFSGTTIPSGEWSSSIAPQKGNYLWSKTTFTWTDGTSPTVEYMVSYTGLDGNDIDIISYADIDTLFT